MIFHIKLNWFSHYFTCCAHTHTHTWLRDFRSAQAFETEPRRICAQKTSKHWRSCCSTCALITARPNADHLSLSLSLALYNDSQELKTNHILTSQWNSPSSRWWLDTSVHFEVKEKSLEKRGGSVEDRWGTTNKRAGGGREGAGLDEREELFQTLKEKRNCQLNCGRVLQNTSSPSSPLSLSLQIYTQKSHVCLHFLNVLEAKSDTAV